MAKKIDGILQSDGSILLPDGRRYIPSKRKAKGQASSPKSASAPAIPPVYKSRKPLEDRAKAKIDDQIYSKPEADKDDIFGQYLFAPERTDVPMPPEENTEEEEKLFVAIQDMFGDKGDANLRKFSKKILELLANNKYAALLSPGDRKAYRGIKITKKELLDLIEPYGEEIKYNEYVTMNLPDKLDPLKGNLLQSWTVDLDQAAKFASYDRPGGRVVAVIFVARTDAEGNNFFGAPKTLASVVYPEYEEEAEVISVGSIEYDGFAYFVSKEDSEKEISRDGLANAAEKVM